MISDDWQKNNLIVFCLSNFVQTALHWAAKSGQLEVVKLVAGCGVDVNAKSVSFFP